jgi:hypothetical protein
MMLSSALWTGQSSIGDPHGQALQLVTTAPANKEA